jgi:hypothetical protein
MSDEQTGGINIGSVAGDLSIQAGGDIVAGNKTVINNIIQRIMRAQPTTPYKFHSRLTEIADRDIFYGRDAIIELAAQVGRHRSSSSMARQERAKALVNAGLIPSCGQRLHLRHRSRVQRPAGSAAGLFGRRPPTYHRHNSHRGLLTTAPCYD